MTRLRDAVHQPDVSVILHNVGDEQMVHAIKEHSERLAIAFGSMVVEVGCPIQIVFWGLSVAAISPLWISPFAVLL